MPVTVVKFDGTREPFSESKLRASAKRVGVKDEMQDELLARVRSKLRDGITTKEIFDEVKEFLREQKEIGLIGRFNLKQGLNDLGPSGYPFEKFVSHVLSSLGYETRVNQMLAGRCVRHEIDVVAKKDDGSYLVETKFHSKSGVKSDVKVTLYIKARYDDVSSNWKEPIPISPWIVTNARFTDDARSYGECVGLKLTSWDYPEGESLRELIDRADLHPITVLGSLPNDKKSLLLDNGIVTCKQVIEGDNTLKTLLSKSELEKIQKEAAAVCRHTA